MDGWNLELVSPKRNLLVDNTEKLYLNHYFIPNLQSTVGYVTVIHKKKCVYVFIWSNLVLF